MKLIGIISLTGILFVLTTFLFFVFLPWWKARRCLKKYPPRKFLEVLRNEPSALPLEEMDPILVSHIVMAENCSFFQSKGFHRGSIKAALIKTLKNRRPTGASSIPQQLARSMYLSYKKDLFRKATEAFITVEQDRTLTKREILFLYLNISYFGNGQYGLVNAAKFYFGCLPKKISKEQTFLFLSLLRGPSGNDPLTRPEKFSESIRVSANRFLKNHYVTGKEYQNILDYYSPEWLKQLAEKKKGSPTEHGRLPENGYAKEIRKKISCAGSP